MYHYFLIDSSVNGHLGCFHVPKVKAAQSCPTLCNPMDYIQSVSSVTQSCPTLCDPMPARQASLSSTNSRSPPNPCPLSRLCHPTNWSSVVPFSSCPQSFPASRSFQMSQLFTSGGKSFGLSASTWVLPMNIQDWFPLGWAAGDIHIYTCGWFTLMYGKNQHNIIL